jgi:hypothetical protein
MTKRLTPRTFSFINGFDRYPSRERYHHRLVLRSLSAIMMSLVRRREPLVVPRES